MPRKGKLIYRRYSEQDLANAIAAVQNDGMTKSKAAKLFQVPRQTLTDYTLGKSTVGKPHGRPTCIPREVERGIVKKVLDSAEAGFPLTKRMVLHKIDSSVLWRFLLNSVLLVLFIVQHSLMATPWFKRKLAYWFNVTVSERLLYVTATCLCLMVVINSWQSIPEVFLWLIDTQERSLLWTFFLILHCLCWLLLGLEVLLMDAGEMIGIHQVYRYHASQPSSLLMEKTLKLCEIYSGMRHPGVVMLTFMLWVHPLMTLDRVLLASVLTTYMVGRPNLDDSHYEFAKKYFREEHEEYRSSSSVRYEYVKEN